MKATTMRLLALIATELLLLPRESYSFNPTPSQRTILPLDHSNRRDTLRWSAVNPVDEQRKQFTRDALQKLRERQKQELAETEYMIERLDRVSNSTTGEIDALDQDGEFSLASSILAGVDYGFVSRSEGSTFGLTGGYPIEGSDAKGEPFSQYGPPGNIFMLGAKQFMRNLNALMGEYNENIVLTPKQRELQEPLEALTLNSTAIWEREMAEGPIVAPWLIKIPYLVLCRLLDVAFEGRNVFGRFFLLETVARMPYFSYIGMLHFYETLGFWRRSSDIKRIHFAEEWNEYHHLLIMESLGGDQRYWVRALAQHSAIMYFFVLCFLWAFSPTLAYKFSELLETHAVNTYGGFLDENEEALKKLPPPISAVNYYSLGRGDPLFGEYQTSAMATNGEIRRPGDNMQSLYDVFTAIKADEGDHVGTMKACLDPNVAVQSPALEKKVLTAAAMVGAISFFLATSDIIDVTTIGDILDSASDGGAVADDGAVGLFEGIAAVVAGIGRQIARDSEEGNNAALFEDLLESGGLAVALESLRQGFLKAFITILEFLAALL